MAEQAAVRALEALGFNLNEGRAYTALLQRGPSTGYEVSQHAGVPRSAVYAVLRRLVGEGAARREPGPPERFTAVPPEALTALLRQPFESSQHALVEALAELDTSPSVPDAFSVEGYERILEEARHIVDGASSTIVASGWPRELNELARALERAVERGVYVLLFSHAGLPEALAGVHFSYGLREADLEAFWRHRLVVVADDRKSLIGATEQKTGDRAVVSETVAIAELAVGQVTLDVTLLAQRHGVDTSEVMGRVLGDRVGRLDTLLAGSVPTLGGSVRRARRSARSRAD